MFKDKTAWFSESVDEQIVKIWFAKGGSVCSMLSADYLFSSDAASADTETIYHSWMYLMHDVTVFHSSYIVACVESKTVKNASIGHFVLPPVKLHNELTRKIGPFIWEVMSPPYTEKEFALKRKRETNDFTTEISLLSDSGIDVTEDGREINKSVHRLDTKGTCCQMRHQNYQVNNLVGNFTHATDMKQYKGCLRDFMCSATSCAVKRM